MGCRGCQRNRKLRGIKSRESQNAADVDFPVVYVLCRNCGVMRTMRFNIATNFVRVNCVECDHKIFHVLKQPPSPEQLKQLIIKR